MDTDKKLYRFYKMIYVDDKKINKKIISRPFAHIGRCRPYYQRCEMCWVRFCECCGSGYTYNHNLCFNNNCMKYFEKNNIINENRNMIKTEVICKCEILTKKEFEDMKIKHESENNDYIEKLLTIFMESNINIPYDVFYSEVLSFLPKIHDYTKIEEI